MILSSALIVGDCNQTVQISGDGHETNMILGKAPSKKKIVLYCGGALAANASIAFMPKKYRLVAWSVVSVFQGAVIASNYSIGYKIKF